MTYVMDILTRVGKAKARVEALTEEEMMLRSMAERTTSAVQTVRIGGQMQVVERVSSTPSVQDRMADTIAEMVDKGAEIEEAIEGVTLAVKDAEKLIFGLPERQYRVLHALYIEGMDAPDVAEKILVSKSTIASDRKSAIEALEAKYAEVECHDC